MPGFEPFRDMTEAERKTWLTVKSGRAAEAGRANADQAKAMVQEQHRADRDRAAEGGRES